MKKLKDKKPKERPFLVLKPESPINREYKNPNSDPTFWLARGANMKYTVEEIREKVENYFNSCYRERRIKTKHKVDGKEVEEIHTELEQVRPFTISGISLALEISPITFNNWATKPNFSTLSQEDNNEIKKICHLARMKIEEYAETKLFQGNNQTGAIFWLKNNAGYADKQQIDQNVTNNVSLGELYKKSLVVEEDNS